MKRLVLSVILLGVLSICVGVYADFMLNDSHQTSALKAWLDHNADDKTIVIAVITAIIGPALIALLKMKNLTWLLSLQLFVVAQCFFIFICTFLILGIRFNEDWEVVVKPITMFHNAPSSLDGSIAFKIYWAYDLEGAICSANEPATFYRADGNTTCYGYDYGRKDISFADGCSIWDLGSAQQGIVELPLRMDQGGLHIGYDSQFNFNDIQIRVTDNSKGAESSAKVDIPAPNFWNRLFSNSIRVNGNSDYGDHYVRGWKWDNGSDLTIIGKFYHDVYIKRRSASIPAK